MVPGSAGQEDFMAKASFSSGPEDEGSAFPKEHRTPLEERGEFPWWEALCPDSTLPGMPRVTQAASVSQTARFLASSAAPGALPESL